MKALDGLGELCINACELLSPRVQDEDKHVRLAAARALGEAGYRSRRRAAASQKAGGAAELRPSLSSFDPQVHAGVPGIRAVPALCLARC